MNAGIGGGTARRASLEANIPRAWAQYSYLCVLIVSQRKDNKMFNDTRIHDLFNKTGPLAGHAFPHAWPASGPKENCATTHEKMGWSGLFRDLTFN